MNDGWNIEKTAKIPRLKNPIFIEGLPGIGNVGKIAMDFIIDKLNAKKIYDIFSYNLPHSVFVTENNLAELPKIEIYHKRFGGKDLLLLTGDVQPIDERACYSFCDEILDLLQKHKVKEIITLGGIGLHKVPRTPKVYCTGNCKSILTKYKANNRQLSSKVYGVVGPIVGVSGVMLGLADRRKLKAMALLSETYGHPLYLGVKGAKEILKVLNKTLGLKITLKDLNKEIDDIEAELKSKRVSKKNLKKMQTQGVDYIG